MINEVVEIIVPEDIMQSWQEIVNILALLCEVPAALIMRVQDPDIEVFISSNSEGNPYHPGDREHFRGSGLYCETVIKTQEKLLVPDALADENWNNNPDVKLNMVSYLGFPILLPNKKSFGTICILDRKRNEYSKTVEQLMLKFRNLIESQIELIHANNLLGDRNKRLTDYLMEIQAFRGVVPICASCKAIRDQQGDWHPIEHYLIKHPEADFSHGICPECIKKFDPDFEEGS